jgi:hypothetical protein
MDHWAVLGIAPTTDEDAVRRAYAARVKQAKSDPQAFMAVRAAYEAILNGKGGRRAAAPQQRTIPLEGALHPDAFGKALVEVLGDPDENRTRSFLRQHLSLTLPLQIAAAYEIVAIRRVGDVPGLSLAHLQFLQEAFAWGDLTHNLAKVEPQAYSSFLKRASAVRLHAQLTYDSDWRNWPRTPSFRRIAARCILGRPFPHAPWGQRKKAFRLLKHYRELIRIDMPWSEAIFDPEILESLEKQKSGLKIYSYVTIGFCCVFYIILVLIGQKKDLSYREVHYILFSTLGAAFLFCAGLVANGALSIVDFFHDYALALREHRKKHR